MRLQGRRILVTGASSGIGEAVAKACVREGAEVILLSEREQEVNAVAEALRQSGGKATAVTVNLAVEAEVAGLIARLESELGEIDTLINNAGIGLGSRIPDITLKGLRLVMEVNYFGMFSLCQQALVAMGKRKQGRVINITSASGRFGLPGVSAYVSSKGAAHTFTSALRIEGKPLGVFVSEVLPVSTSTRFFESVEGKKYQPKGVVQTPETVANAIVKCACSRRPRAEVLPYPPVRLAFVVDALFPGLLDRFLDKK